MITAKTIYGLEKFAGGKEVCLVPSADSRGSDEDIEVIPATGGVPKRLTRMDKELWSVENFLLVDKNEKQSDEGIGILFLLRRPRRRSRISKTEDSR